MTFAIVANLREDSCRARAELRASHLRYIAANKHFIVAGGPTLREGQLVSMIILARFPKRTLAEAFIRDEPYAASGRVFSQVEILDWSQVLPEEFSGQLDALAGAEPKPR